MELEFVLPVEAKQGVATQWGIADRLLVVILEQLKNLSLSFPSKDVVLKAAGEAYDKYVAPFDIPFVPNLIEPLVDAALRSQFLAAVDRIYDSLQAGS